MIVTRSRIRPVYKWVRDMQASSADRAVLQMNVIFGIKGFISGEQSLEPTTASLLNDLRVRVPNTDSMAAFIEPDLEPSDYAFYTRASYKEGSDYTTLPALIYDWKIVDSHHEFDANSEVYQTWYELAGRWWRYKGLFYNVAHKLR